MSERKEQNDKNATKFTCYLRKSTLMTGYEKLGNRYWQSFSSQSYTLILVRRFKISLSSIYQNLCLICLPAIEN